MSNFHEIEIHRLHYTTITVGTIEVQEKRKALRDLKITYYKTF